MNALVSIGAFKQSLEDSFGAEHDAGVSLAGQCHSPFLHFVVGD